MERLVSGFSALIFGCFASLLSGQMDNVVFALFAIGLNSYAIYCFLRFLLETRKQ